MALDLPNMHLAPIRGSNHPCLICGKGIKGSIDFMLDYGVWLTEAGLSPKGHAHLECIQDKIGRPIVANDLLKRAGMNWWAFEADEMVNGWGRFKSCESHNVERFYVCTATPEAKLQLYPWGWRFGYTTDSLKGVYDTAHITFQVRHGLDIEDAIDWAEELMEIHPPRRH